MILEMSILKRVVTVHIDKTFFDSLYSGGHWKRDVSMYISTIEIGSF